MSPNRNVRGAAQAAVRVGLGLALVAMIAVIPASSARATASYALVASGERRMGALVDAVRVRRVVISDAGMLANVNTPHSVPDEERPDAGSCDQP